MITTTLTGEQQLNERLQNLSNAKFFDALLSDTAQRVFDEVEKAMAPHSKTGLLEKSLGDGVQKLGDRTYEVVSSGQIAPYNIFIAFGTRPHDIKPSKKKALRWVSGNSFVFAKWIKHPGYVGDNFFITATNNVLRDFDQIASSHLKDV